MKEAGRDGRLLDTRPQPDVDTCEFMTVLRRISSPRYLGMFYAAWNQQEVTEEEMVDSFF